VARSFNFIEDRNGKILHRNSTFPGGECQQMISPGPEFSVRAPGANSAAGERNVHSSYDSILNRGHMMAAAECLGDNT
jgi:hypothetical protein